MPSRKRTRQRDPRAGHGRGRRRKSGHPGMPMGMADIAEVLWNASPAPQPRQSAVARPRSLRAVQRSRLDAAVRAAASDRLRPADRRDQALPPAALEDAGPSRGRRSRPASKRRPGRSDRASPTPSAWRSRRQLLAARVQSAGHEIVDHRTYVFVGDGCLMEGISHEACSLAGTLGLGKLDRVLRRQRHLDRRRSRHGWFTDDTPKRFEAYGWHVIARRRRPRRRRGRRARSRAAHAVTDGRR